MMMMKVFRRCRSSRMCHDLKHQVFLWSSHCSDCKQQLTNNLGPCALVFHLVTFIQYLVYSWTMGGVGSENDETNYGVRINECSAVGRVIFCAIRLEEEVIVLYIHTCTWMCYSGCCHFDIKQFGESQASRVQLISPPSAALLSDIGWLRRAPSVRWRTLVKRDRFFESCWRM